MLKSEMGGQIYAYTDANLDGIDDNTGIAFGFYDSGLGDYAYFYTGGMSAIKGGKILLTCYIFRFLKRPAHHQPFQVQTEKVAVV